MFQKVFEYAGPHKKGLYAATAIVLVSVLLGVFPFVLAYQVIAPLVMGEAITASFIIQHVILVLVCLVLSKSTVPCLDSLMKTPTHFSNK